MLGKIEGKKEKRAPEDEMVGWHHQLNGHEFEQALGDGEGQGGLNCCSPWGHKESDATEQQDNNLDLAHLHFPCILLITASHRPAMTREARK